MKNINIFKQLFNWVQSAPVDFCYVTGEWSFQGKAIAKPALSSATLQSTNNRRSLEAIRTPAVAVARIFTPAAAPAPVTAAADDPSSHAA
jgi:hypothetical protein